MTIDKRDDGVFRVDDIVELRIPVEIDGERYYLVPRSELSIRQARRIDLLHQRVVDFEAAKDMSVDDAYDALVDLVQEIFIEIKPGREVLEGLAGRKLQAIYLRFLEISEEELDTELSLRAMAPRRARRAKVKRTSMKRT